MRSERSTRASYLAVTVWTFVDAVDVHNHVCASTAMPDGFSLLIAVKPCVDPALSEGVAVHPSLTSPMCEAAPTSKDPGGHR